MMNRSNWMRIMDDNNNGSYRNPTKIIPESYKIPTKIPCSHLRTVWMMKMSCPLTDSFTSTVVSVTGQLKLGLHTGKTEIYNTRACTDALPRALFSSPFSIINTFIFAHIHYCCNCVPFIQELTDACNRLVML